jgi:hypothetical protein
VTATIPRSEIYAVAERYGDPWRPRSDPSADRVRLLASEYRKDANYAVANGSTLLAEADDLDALADRYEQEAA